MADGLKQHALSSNDDFYDILGVPPTASESEIRRAWRRTAPKYHPDKVGASNTEALEKFHLLQIALDVLVDETARQLYDNARRARQEKQVREEKLHGRRRAMKEDLERRESGFLKRQREEVEVEEAFQRELRRLAEDGKRRRKEREEALRKEAMADAQEFDAPLPSSSFRETETAQEGRGGATEVDRSITLRFEQNSKTRHIDENHLRIALEQNFGAVDEVLFRDKKVKVDDEKHRRRYTVAVVAFKSVVGAHACMTDFDKLARSGTGDWHLFEAVNWVGGKPPDSVLQATPQTSQTKPSDKLLASLTPESKGPPQTPVKQGGAAGPGPRKVPSFASFKGTPKTLSPLVASNTPSKDDTMMMRLREAQKRKIEGQRIHDQTAAEENAAPVA